MNIKKDKGDFFWPKKYSSQFKKIIILTKRRDVIVKFIFDCIGISKPTYLDVGAHHPYISNTALFYESGSIE
jgi:hypothetical protein